MSRARLKAAGLLVAVFVLGILTGAGAVAWADREGGARDRRPGPDAYVDRLTKELSLSPAQRDTVRAVLERRRPGMEALRAEMQPRFESWRDSVRAEIRTHLSPAQRTTYEEMLRRHDAERHRRPADARR